MAETPLAQDLRFKQKYAVKSEIRMGESKVITRNYQDSYIILISAKKTSCKKLQRCSKRS